jgi:predicted ATPase
VLEEEMKSLIYLGPIRSYPPRHLLPSNNNDPNWIAGGAAAWERLRDDKDVRERVNNWLGTTEKLGTKYRIEVRKLVDLQSSDLEDKFYQAAQDIDFQLSELKEWDGEGGIVGTIKEKLSDEGSIEGVNDIALVDLNSNTTVTHRDVGFGLSQVIPVLVAAMANRNRIILIEQPEIHLHPALQAELGDVIIESALGDNKNNLILENHSEHLMLRILRRIRENNEGNAPNNLPKITPDDVQVIYIKPSKEGSVLYDIPITIDGDFAVRWPDGFFPERAEELFANE